MILQLSSSAGAGASFDPQSSGGRKEEKGKEALSASGLLLYLYLSRHVYVCMCAPNKSLSPYHGKPLLMMIFTTAKK